MVYGNRWILYFGYKIKDENLFDGIATENEEIINKDGLFANVLTYERGFSTFLNGGKAFTFMKEMKQVFIFLPELVT